MYQSVIKTIGKKINSAGALGYLNWMPDALYLKIIYRSRMGKALDIRNPELFSEKMQWLKLFDRNPLYTKMVDKYEAKEYVSQIIGDEFTIKTLGVWDSFEDIDFATLPNQFVLKCTHDSGGLVICRDKSTLDLDKAREKIEGSMKVNYFWSTREWPYKNVKPRIIAEEYMEDETNTSGLTDYKFFCFNKKPRFLYVSQGLENHDTAGISFYDFSGVEMPFKRTDYRSLGPHFELPSNFEELLMIAEKLADSVNSAFARIDLYSINGKCYFSEITFSPCSGMMPITPKEWDWKLGEWIELPSKR